MKIGILGAGNVGGRLGKVWAQKGHDVMFSSRQPDSERMNALLEEVAGNAVAGSLDETIAYSNILVLSVPWEAVREILTSREDWSGKIIIDATNRLAPPGDDEAPTAAETVAQWAPGAKVVKAYNTIGAEHIENPNFHGQVASMFICGDHDAREDVRSLIIDSGFEVVEVGDLDKAILLEYLARLWITLAFESGYGRDIGFKLLLERT